MAALRVSLFVLVATLALTAVAREDSAFGKVCPARLRALRQPAPSFACASASDMLSLIACMRRPRQAAEEGGDSGAHSRDLYHHQHADDCQLFVRK